MGLIKPWGWRAGVSESGIEWIPGIRRARGWAEGPVLRRESLGARKLEKSSVGGPRRRGRYQPRWRWGKGGSPGAGGSFSFAKV